MISRTLRHVTTSEHTVISSGHIAPLAGAGIRAVQRGHCNLDAAHMCGHTERRNDDGRSECPLLFPLLSH